MKPLGAVSRAGLIFGSLLLLGFPCRREPLSDPGIVTIGFVMVGDEGGLASRISSFRIEVVRMEAILRSDPDESSSEERIELAVSHGTEELTGLAEGVPRISGQIEIPPGYLAQLRFVISSASAVIDGELVEITIPSGPETGLKLVPKHQELPLIRDRKRTTLLVEFDPDKAVVDNLGNGFMLKPTAAMESIPVAELTTIDPAHFLVLFRATHAPPFDPEADIVTAVSELGGERIWSNPFHRRQVLIRVPEGDDREALRDALMETYSSDSRVAVVSFHTYAELAVAPSDPSYGPLQWEMRNDGTAGKTLDADVDGEEAWDLIAGSIEVVVAVLDTGIDAAHPDLFRNIWINGGEVGPYATDANRQWLLRCG